MTAEDVCMYAKSYRLYFRSESHDFIKYHGYITTTPLIKHRDRQYYYRLANKLNDEQIHATLLLAFFFNPSGYIVDACTPEALSAGIAFAARAENGPTVFKHDLYALRKALPKTALDDWFYGAFIDGTRETMPGCIGSIIRKELPLDLAAMLLLVPHAELNYAWAAYWEHREPVGSMFGVRPWLSALRKADQLINWRRPGWRRIAHTYSRGFWGSYQQSLGPLHEHERLFA